MNSTLKHIAFILAFLSSMQLHAGHIAGANIEYECIGGGQYEITLNIFRDCQEIDLGPSLPVRWISECSTTAFGSINAQYVPSESEEVSQLCSSSLINSSCSGGNEPGIFKHVFKAIWTPPASCDVWRLQYFDCNRAQTLNIFDPSNNNCLVVYNYIYTQLSQCNNSPIIGAQQIPYVCVGADVEYNFGAYDIDGDSLSFSLVPAASATGNPIFNLTYEPGYSGAEPIPGATIDPVSGQISFTPILSGRYTVVVLIEQFDVNGNLIGAMVFDLFFTALNCPNGPPEIPNVGLTNFNGSAEQTDNLSVEMCYGEDFCADIEFSSPNPGASLIIESNIADILPGGTITLSGTNPVIATLCWTAIDGALGGTVLLTADDDLCPIPGILNVGVAINVIPSVYGGPDTTLCPGQSYQFNAIGSTDYQWSSISGDPIIIGTNFSCNNCPNPIASPSQETTYLLTGTGIINQCSNTDQITIAMGTPDVEAGPNDTSCGLSYQFDASTPTGVGTWLGGPIGSTYSPNVNDPQATVTVPSSGTHTFFWQDNAGMGCVGTDQVTIIFSSTPVADAGADLVICGLSDSLHANSAANGVSHWEWTAAEISVTNPLDPNSPISASTLGTYTLTWVADNNGCTDTDNVLVSFVDYTIADAGPDRTFCENSGILLSGNASGEGSWEAGTLTVAIDDLSDPNATITNQGPPGTYEIRFITGLGGDCEDADTVLVTFEPPAIADAGSDTEFCSLSGSLSAVSVANGLSHWQYNPAEVTLDDDFDPSSGITASTSGTYELIWVEVLQPCTDQDTVLITLNQVLNADAGQDIAVCGNEVTLGANGSLGDGTWSIINGLVQFSNINDPNATVSVLSCGQQAEIKWSLGGTSCPTEDTVVIDFFCQPQADAGDDDSNICGTSYVLEALPSTGSGVWSTTTSSPMVTFQDSSDPNTSITTDGPGTVVLTWTETTAGTSCSDSDDVTLTFFSLPIADAGQDTSLCSSQYQLNAIPSFGDGFWFGPIGTSFENNAHTIPDAIVHVPSPGTYTFTWNEFVGSCISQDDVTITFLDEINPDAGEDDQVCGDTYSLSVSGVIGSGSWTANPNTVTFSNGPSSASTDVTVSNYGVYELIWTEMAGICSNADTLLVEFTEQPAGYAGNDTIICGFSIALNPQITAANGNWSSSDTEISFTDSSDPQTTAFSNAAGTYSLVWSEANGNCSSSDTMLVTFTDIPSAVAGPIDSACGLSYELQAELVTGTGQWQGIGLSFSDENSATSEIMASSYGTYELIWTINDGACSSSDTTLITFVATPTANAGPDQHVCGDQTDMVAIPSFGSGTWTFPAIVQGVDPSSPSMTLQTNGISYPLVELIWTETSLGCSSSDTTLIQFVELPIANAGENQSVCGTSTTLMAQLTAGTGTWIEFPAGASIDVSNPNSAFSMPSFGEYFLVWEETNQSCSTQDTVFINFIETPVANAGLDISICGLSAQVGALPSFGDGEWMPNTDVIYSNADNPTSHVTASTFVTTELIWIETEGICSDSDTVLVTFIDSPIANAGADENACGLNATLEAVISTGTGTWIDFPAEVSLIDITDPESTISASDYGTYTLVWEETDGTCTTTDTVVYHFLEIPNAEAGIDFELCGLEASLNALPSIGSGTWTNVTGAQILDSGNPNSQVSVPGFGSYTFTWTESNQSICSQTDDIVVTFLPSPIADAGADDAICGLSYSLNANLSTGSGLWTVPSGVLIDNPNNENAMVEAPSFGLYEFIWTESNADCFTTDTVMIEFLETPNTFAGPDLDFCGNTGALEAISSAGIGTWTVPNGLTASSLNDANAIVTGNPGTYVLIWTEDNGGLCQGQDDMTITLWEIPISDAGEDDDVCGTSYQLSANSSAGTGVWTSTSPDVIFSPNASAPNAIATVADCGNYTFQWSEENFNCTDFDTVDIQFNCAPDTSDVTIICINSNTQYQVSFDIDGGDPGSYEITGDPGNIGGNSFLGDPIDTGDPYSFFVADQYNCDIIEVSGTFTCESLSESGSMNIDTLHACVGELATAVYNNDGFLDPNDALTFVMHDNSGNSIGTVYASNSLEPTFGIQPSMTSDVVYYISSVVGDDNGSGTVDLSANGISVSVGTPVIFHSSPSAQIIGNEAILCEGQATDIEINLSGQAPFNVAYTYNSVDTELNGIASNQFTFSADQAGNVTLTSMSDLYCEGLVDGDIDIVVYEVPELDVADTLRTCSANPEDIAVSLSGNGPWTFDLYIDATFTSSYTLNNVNDVIPSSVSGSYALVGLNDAFCVSADTSFIGVDVVESPSLLAGDDAVLCQGETVLLGESPISAFDYEWSNTASLNAFDIATPLASIDNPSSEPISETFELMVTNDICSTIDQVSVTINPLPIDFGIVADDSICAGEAISISAFGGISYTWTSGEAISDSSSHSPIISPSADAQYVVEISNQYSCSVSDSVFITVNELPQVNSISGTQDGCIPLTVTWTNLTPTEQIAQCAWNNFGGTIISETCDELVLEYTLPGDYTVELEVTTPEGCSATQLSPDTVNVTGAFAEILYQPLSPTIDDPWVQAFDGSQPNAVTWAWTVDGELVSNSADPYLTFDSLEASTYDVCLAIVSNNGCPDTACVEVVVGTNFQLWVPLAFSPNSDNLNDLFRPVINHPEDLDLYEFRVYDRRGHVKFETTRYLDGWDGINIRENDVMQGLYQWEVIYRIESEFKIRTRRGHFTLLR